MVDQTSAGDSGNEINSDTTVSLNLCGATIAFGDDENDNDNHSDEDGDQDSHSLQLSNSVLPPNTSLNIENSSDVIVGSVTQFHGPVTIYQNTHNNIPALSDTPTYLSNASLGSNSVNSTPTVCSTAKLVASESLSGKPIGNVPFSNRKVTLISLLVFLIIVLLTVIISYGVGMYITYDNNKDTSTPSDDLSDIKSTIEKPQIPGSRHKMIYRDIWGGKPALYERPQKVPVKYVIISHTAGAECFDIRACSKQMVLFQSIHVGAGSPDVGYNFVIGGDANIYVGRGWDNHNFHMNLDTIGICFIGDYVYNILSPGMIEAANQLLKLGIEKGKLDKDYILVAHNQTYNTISPGANVYNQIKFWPHFSSEYLTDINDN